MRSLLALLLLGLLAAPAAAQLDLPERPVRPAGGGSGVEVRPAKRGDLADRVTGKEKEPVPLDLPGEARPAETGTPLPTSGAAPGTPPTAGQALGAAAGFILDELRRARASDGRLADQAVHSLRNLGEPGLAAARDGLAGDDAAVLAVCARVLLESGDPADAQLVRVRLAGRLPREACGPLVAAVAAADPVRASPELFAELLAHPQSQMRSAAQHELERLPPAMLIAVLPSVLESKATDTRLRAVALAANSSDPGAVDLLVQRLGDPSAVVGRRAIEALAGREDERVQGLLLKRAFDGRWVLRESAYALLAVIEREDLRIEALLGPEHVDALLGGLGSSDPFVSGACAAALAGVGFRSPPGERTAWLEGEVPARLVRTLSGVEFHNDLSALQPAAVRRLSLISGQHFGTEGLRWVEWWDAARGDFHALRAVLPVTVEDAPRLRVDWIATGGEPRAFRLVGPDPAAAEGATSVERTLVLSERQAAELFDVLAREGLFEAARLPGTRGAAGTQTRSLEVALGGRAKAFGFRGASEPWFDRAAESARALYARNRWQLYLQPGLESDTRAAFEREGAWWDEEHSEAERERRLVERVLGHVRGLPVSQREDDLNELASLAERLTPEDLPVLTALLAEERFHGTRSHTLVALCRTAMGEDAAGRLPTEPALALIETVETTFGETALDELRALLASLEPDVLFETAADPRPLVRMLVPSVLAERGDDPSRALAIAMLDDDDARVEAAAVAALGAMRETSQRTEVLLRARSAEPRVRAAALQALGRLGGDGALDALLIGLSERETPELAVAAARGLAALGDPSTAPLMLTLAVGEDEALVAPAREGLLALGPAAWPELLRAVRTPGHRARREAALLLSRQSVPEAAPALIAWLGDDGGDQRVAAELAVLTGVDLRAEADPAAAWYGWWNGVVRDDALAWFLGGAARAGYTVPEREALAGEGNAEGALFLLGLLGDGPAHLAERARRQLSLLLGREVTVPPPEEPARAAWFEGLRSEIATRYK